MMRMASPLCVDRSHSGEEEGEGLDSPVDEVIHAGLPDPLCIIFILFFALCVVYRLPFLALLILNDLMLNLGKSPVKKITTPVHFIIGFNQFVS